MTDPNCGQPLQLEHDFPEWHSVVNGASSSSAPLGRRKASRSRAAPIARRSTRPNRGSATATDRLQEPAVEVIRDSSTLDGSASATIDISPAVQGNNTLEPTTVTALRQPDDRTSRIPRTSSS
jgi:hypothetical protein